MDGWCVCVCVCVFVCVCAYIRIILPSMQFKLLNCVTEYISEFTSIDTYVHTLVRMGMHAMYYFNLKSRQSLLLK